MCKLTMLFITFLIVGCGSLHPYGNNSNITQSYYYKDSAKPGAVYSCVQNELFSQGYLLEYGKLNNKSGINHFDVKNQSHRVARLEINNFGSSVSSRAFVKDERVRKDMDAAQSYCEKVTGHSSSITVSVLKGIWEGLKYH